MDNSSRYAYFTYRNHSSVDFGIFIKRPFTLVHATPDYTKTHINGRNGDFIQDEGSFQNVTETFDVEVHRPKKYKTLFEYESELTDWLTGNDYSPLSVSTFANYAFKAIYDTPLTITWDDSHDEYGSGQISFNCMPFFRRTDGLKYQPLPSNGVVYNQEKVPAIPDWHFTANGGFTLYVNDKPYEFNAIDGDVWLNGQEGNATSVENGDYDTLINTNMRLANNEAPVILPNQKNTISITPDSGTTVTSEWRPNWGRLI